MSDRIRNIIYVSLCTYTMDSVRMLIHWLPNRSSRTHFLDCERKFSGWFSVSYIYFKGNYNKYIGNFCQKNVTALETELKMRKWEIKQAAGCHKMIQKRENLNRKSMFLQALNNFLRQCFAVNSLLLSPADISNPLLHSYKTGLWPTSVPCDASEE
jgi:hypothetical protein